MSTFLQVDPQTLVNVSAQTPAHGRGAWSKAGIDFEYRYAVNPDGQARIGTVAERSLAHWAVAAGAWAIQSRLITLGHMSPLVDTEKGMYGPKTAQAVRTFQSTAVDPDGGAKLVVDGIVGRSDCRALWTPLLDVAERTHGIPSRLLRGETAWESALDPGAVGYYVFYGDGDYRGVDRGISQINSQANSSVTWRQAYDPAFAFNWSAERMRSYFNRFKSMYPSRSTVILWDAALCAHNNPSAAQRWASAGTPPTTQAATYVASVKNAIY